MLMVCWCCRSTMKSMDKLSLTTARPAVDSKKDLRAVPSRIPALREHSLTTLWFKRNRYYACCQQAGDCSFYERRMVCSPGHGFRVHICRLLCIYTRSRLDIMIDVPHWVIWKMREEGCWYSCYHSQRSLQRSEDCKQTSVWLELNETGWKRFQKNKK